MCVYNDSYICVRDDDLLLLFHDSVEPFVTGLLYIEIHTYIHARMNART